MNQEQREFWKATSYQFRGLNAERNLENRIAAFQNAFPGVEPPNTAGSTPEPIDPKVEKKSKFGSHKETRHGMRFDSKLEAKRWEELSLELAAGRISHLRHHRPFKIRVRGEHVCAYISDFSYVRDNRHVIEDTKSSFTRRDALYRLKKKLMKIVLGIDIQEIGV